MTDYRNYVRFITAYNYIFGLTKTSTPRTSFKRTKFHFKAVPQRCSVKELFLEILQNSQENTCARVSFFIKLQT